MFFLTKPKEFLSKLGEMKTDVAYIVEYEKLSSGQISLGQNDDANNVVGQTDLVQFGSKHQQFVQLILKNLEKLDKLLPKAKQIQKLMKPINETLGNVEEVNDYLQTADCPVSKKDLLQVDYNF